MELTYEDREEIIYTIMDKEYVSKDCYDTIHTLKAVAELEIRALNEQAVIDGWNDDLIQLKEIAEHKVNLYTEVLKLIYVWNKDRE